MRETPGPIPNPEAKPHSADGTARVTAWESRTPPEHHSRQGHPHQVALTHFHTHSARQLDWAGTLDGRSAAQLNRAADSHVGIPWTSLTVPMTIERSAMSSTPSDEGADQRPSGGSAHKPARTSKLPGGSRQLGLRASGSKPAGNIRSCAAGRLGGRSGKYRAPERRSGSADRFARGHDTISGFGRPASDRRPNRRKRRRWAESVASTSRWCGIAPAVGIPLRGLPARRHGRPGSSRDRRPATDVGRRPDQGRARLHERLDQSKVVPSSGRSESSGYPKSRPESSGAARDGGRGRPPERSTGSRSRGPLGVIRTRDIKGGKRTVVMAEHPGVTIVAVQPLAAAPTVVLASPAARVAPVTIGRRLIVRPVRPPIDRRDRTVRIDWLSTTVGTVDLRRETVRITGPGQIGPLGQIALGSWIGRCGRTGSASRHSDRPSHADRPTQDRSARFGGPSGKVGRPGQVRPAEVQDRGGRPGAPDSRSGGSGAQRGVRLRRRAAITRSYGSLSSSATNRSTTGASRPSRPMGGRNPTAARWSGPGAQTTRWAWPDAFPVDETIEPTDLDPVARRELRTLTKENSDLVARHLIAAGRALEDDPALALQHARAARALAGRVGIVREAVGLAAYHAGEYVEALAELRTASRITGSAEHLPVMADCERGMGRPDRALKMFDDPAVKELDAAAGVELLLVMSGARRDLGQPDAGVAILDVPALHSPRIQPWTPRLWYGYAEALLAAGRTEDAASWFASVDAIDEESETDAADRLAEILGDLPEDPASTD